MEAASTRDTRLAGLDRLGTTGGPLNTATLILVKSDFQPGPDLVFADLDEADFAGYAAAAGLDPNSAYVDGDGNYRVSYPSQHFEATGPTPSNLLYGWAIVNAGLTAVRFAAKFDTPIPIQFANDGVDVLASLIWGG